MTSVLKPLNVVARINRDVERSLLRARNGVRYATTKANVGATPRDVVWRRDRAELWRYRSATPIRYQPPVVIVHSLVSRSYILDLRPGSSAVEFLPGCARTKPDLDGVASRLLCDGRDDRRSPRGPSEPRRTRRRKRERPCGRALQRLLHAGANEASRSIRNAAREPVERRVRRGLPGDVTVV